MWPRLVWNSLYNPDKPSACYLPVSASRVLRFQACTSSLCFLPSITQHSWLLSFQVGSLSSVLYPRVSSFKSEGERTQVLQNESRRLLIYMMLLFWFGDRILLCGLGWPLTEISPPQPPFVPEIGVKLELVLYSLGWT